MVLTYLHLLDPEDLPLTSWDDHGWSASVVFQIATTRQRRDQETRLLQGDNDRENAKARSSLQGPDSFLMFPHGSGYPLVICYIAIENGHRNSGFSHSKWWFSIAMLNYQRVNYNISLTWILRPAMGMISLINKPWFQGEGEQRGRYNLPRWL